MNGQRAKRKEQFICDLGFVFAGIIKGTYMKKITLLFAFCSVLVVLAGCAKKCEVEPIVEQNQKLIVPPNFGNMPK